MLVRDSLQVGDQTAQAGITAGPIWHLGPVAPPLTGGDRGVGQWVLSQNASVNLFAQFSLEPRPEALHVGVQCVDVWSKENQQTAYANVTLTAGRHSFVSLLVPARAADVPQPHAQQRSFESTVVQSGSGVVATVRWPNAQCGGSPYCGTELRMTLGDDADEGWGVERRPLKHDDDQPYRVFWDVGNMDDCLERAAQGQPCRVNRHNLSQFGAAPSATRPRRVMTERCVACAARDSAVGPGADGLHPVVPNAPAERFAIRGGRATSGEPHASSAIGRGHDQGVDPRFELERHRRV